MEKLDSLGFQVFVEFQANKASMDLEVQKQQWLMFSFVSWAKMQQTEWKSHQKTF